MSDELLRALRRTWEASGLREDEARYRHELERRVSPLVDVTLASTDEGIEQGADAFVEVLGRLEPTPRFDEDAAASLVHAVREALMNGSHHGAAPIRLCVRIVEGALHATITDGGRGFDHRPYTAFWPAWSRANPPDPSVRGPSPPGRPPGGLGFVLLFRFCDEVRWNEAGNEVTLVKRLPP